MESAAAEFVVPPLINCWQMPAAATFRWSRFGPATGWHVQCGTSWKYSTNSIISISSS